jgi:predicted TIM-barrel fold metal-dependent hydrolase
VGDEQKEEFIMILDGHIHIGDGEVDGLGFAQALKTAGIDGGVILSDAPNSFTHRGKGKTTLMRLDNLFEWAETNENLYPFFWIDPTEVDILDQIEMANERGVYGFKVICNHFYPGDPRAMEAYRAIAALGKPILFHSGILWDGRSSSKYNHPAEFEDLLEIDNLKFCLAHVSWPWFDECIAVYGKFLNSYSNRPDLSVEMFIDITPGTPPIYREEVLTKLYTIGYDIENNIIFGTDGSTNKYNHKWAAEWQDRDNKIYNKLGLSHEAIDKVYSENLKRFLGLTDKKVKHSSLTPANS